MLTHAHAYTLRHTNKHTLNALERGVCLFVCMCLGEGPEACNYFTETCVHLRPRKHKGWAVDVHMPCETTFCQYFYTELGESRILWLIVYVFT